MYENKQKRNRWLQNITSYQKNHPVTEKHPNKKMNF